jgi:hypothetical protein
MILSAISLLMSGVQAVCGSILMQIIQTEVRENPGGPNQPLSILQLETAHGYQITVGALTGASFLSAMISFGWDYIAYSASNALIDCQAYFLS